jgi:AI-2 transport protein TqsA
VSDDNFYKAALGIVLVFAAGVVLKLARPVFIPFILAIFLSYIIDPALDFLTRCRCPRPWAVVIVLAMMGVFLYLVGVLVYSSGKAFVTELPKYQERLADLGRFLEKGFGPFKVDVPSVLGSLDVNRIGRAMLGAIGPFFSVLGKLLLVFLFLVSIVAGRGRAEAKIPKAIGDGHAGRIHGVLERINVQIRKYLVIKTAICIANGLMVWIVLKAFGVDFAFLFGLIAFALNYIPNIGSVIATVLRVGFAFFQFGTLWNPLWILIITTGLDNILGNIIEPRVMGKGLGLSPLLVFFSLLFWGWLWGVPGRILSIPLTAVVRIVCQNVPALRPVAVLMGPCRSRWSGSGKIQVVGLDDEGLGGYPLDLAPEKRFEGLFGGRLFGGLLGTALRFGRDLVAETHLDQKSPAVGRAFFRDQRIGRGRKPGLLADLLESRLGVVDRLRLGLDRLERRLEQAADEGPGRLEAAVEIEGARQRLEGAGQDRDLLPSAALLFAAAEEDGFVELDGPGELGQGQRARRRRLELRELALAPLRKGVEEELRGDEPDDRVAEKLELLVVVRRLGARFISVGAVGQGLLEQPAVPEHMADGLLQAFERPPVEGHGRLPGPASSKG